MAQSAEKKNSWKIINGRLLMVYFSFSAKCLLSKFKYSIRSKFKKTYKNIETRNFFTSYMQFLAEKNEIYFLKKLFCFRFQLLLELLRSTKNVFIF